LKPAQARPSPGCITDVAGLQVGHHTLKERPTGCTVVLCDPPAVCGVDVRGGAPGTRETDLLHSDNVVDRIHAVLLTGGSAFGLAAADGVMQWLEEHGRGLKVGPAQVPIVPAAVLFDLWVGDARIRPNASSGYAACEAAQGGPSPQGCIGAGAGATVGKLFGVERAMKGGLGTASVKVGAITVGALMAVNAIGDVMSEDGHVLAGARTANGRELAGAQSALLAGEGPAKLMTGMATTIGVVATDAALTKAQANKLASLAHHGLSRAVNPLTMNDGDTLFAISTGKAGLPGDMSALGAMAAEAVARAIRNAIWAATSDRTPGLPAWSDLAKG
jgi:L-aminopeptidase/D-esterase-like protein